jgi:cytochrome c553
MQPLAADLRVEDMHNLANYYAGMTPPSPKPPSADQALIEAGRQLALKGAPDKDIPPCMACHGNPPYPRLAGQHRAYMANQLRLRKMGHNPGTDGAAIMAPIIQQLSYDDINAVTPYFSTLSPQSRKAEVP